MDGFMRIRRYAQFDPYFLRITFTNTEANVIIF